MSWERNEILSEWHDAELAKWKQDNANHIKPPLTERQKWFRSMPMEEAIKVIAEEMKEETKEQI